ncbi:MAG: penicillin-binding protein 2 [Bacteroidales bacterium]|nr:penicillin-binding protein 2 [Bacteroidales bacterium]
MQKYSDRKYVIGAIIIVIALIYISRLFWIQVVDDKYKLIADRNSTRRVTQFPARGLIYDRNDNLIVYNMAAYDLMVVPRQLEEFDTVDLCKTLGIEIDYLKKKLSKAWKKNPYQGAEVLKQISDTLYANLQEKLHKYPGFYVQSRTLRKYPHDAGANVLGYVSEVSKSIANNNSYYKSGDYIGYSGIEKTYEKVLRGQKGVNYNVFDVHNRKMGAYKDGKFDTLPRIGGNLKSTLDIELQKYGELLMQNKIGGIVAIEPSTGEILASVTAPSYSPSTMVGRSRSVTYPILNKDPLKPLYNRATMAPYPPGSTFKMITGLIGLQEGVLKPYHKYSCAGAYYSRGVTVGCHHHVSPIALDKAVQMSCNTYFCHVFRKIIDKPEFGSVEKGLNKWGEYVKSFGLGVDLETDLESERKGILPTVKRYNRVYRRGGWSSLTIISISIGQGEISVTPLQLANMTSAIANRGYYYTPHIIKDIAGNGVDKRFKKRHYTKIDSSYFNDVIVGMDLAVNGIPGSGSTATIARIKDVDMCGKTGTAQNPHGDNHSVFVSFAPKDNPKIAIAILVENAGYGASWAAPIASLMVEKYLKGDIDENRKWLEKRILDKDFISELNSEEDE